MSIDAETAASVAHLARIRVEEDELAPLAAELSGILGWVEQLQTVDVSDVGPMTSVTPVALAWREDEVTDGDIHDRVLANAPDARAGFFVVPKVVE